MDFKTILNHAKHICDGNRLFNEFSTIYTFTTENISGYIDFFDLKDKKLLTVGSSGDQVLNAYYKGAKDITLYDINEFAKYYIYLKIAAISYFDYLDFQRFFFKHGQGFGKYYNNKMFDKEMFDKFKGNLKSFDYESYLFFDELFSIYKPCDIREYLFDDDECRNPVIKGTNLYLNNEQSYNLMKSKIKDIHFDFINGDIFKGNINGKYDNIFLSNLCTVTSIEDLKKLLNKLDDNLKGYGSILFAYLWNCSFDNEDYKNEYKDIYKIPIVKKELEKYITEAHNIIGTRDILWEEAEKRDMVLIYRKNI